MDTHLSAFIRQFLRVSLMALAPVLATAFYTTQTHFAEPVARSDATAGPVDRHMT